MLYDPTYEIGVQEANSQTQKVEQRLPRSEEVRNYCLVGKELTVLNDLEECYSFGYKVWQNLKAGETFRKRYQLV